MWLKPYVLFYQQPLAEANGNDISVGLNKFMLYVIQI